MTTYHVPKGVSFDTLREILVGWSAVGAAAEPRYTSSVEDETGISDAVGRQNRFLEQLDVLDTEGQKHQLTGIGQALAGALAVGDEERAKARAREILEDWQPTEDIRGHLRENPTAKERLVPVVAAVTGQDADVSRVRSGITTLLDFYEWADLLERDSEGRYVLPGAEPEEGVEAKAEEKAAKAEEKAAKAEEAEAAATEEPTGVEEAPETAAEMLETGEPVTASEAASELVGGRAVAEANGGVVSESEATEEGAGGAETAGELPGEAATALTAVEELVDEVQTATEAAEQAAEAATEAAEAATEAAEEGVGETTEETTETATEKADETEGETGEEAATVVSAIEDLIDEVHVAAEGAEQAATEATEAAEDVQEVVGQESDSGGLEGEESRAGGDETTAEEAEEVEETTAEEAEEVEETAAEEAERGGGASASTESADGHALTLKVDLDADSADLEALVQGLRRGLLETE